LCQHRPAITQRLHEAQNKLGLTLPYERKGLHDACMLGTLAEQSSAPREAGRVGLERIVWVRLGMKGAHGWKWPIGLLPTTLLRASRWTVIGVDALMFDTTALSMREGKRGQEARAVKSFFSGLSARCEARGAEEAEEQKRVKLAILQGYRQDGLKAEFHLAKPLQLLPCFPACLSAPPPRQI
jgi:hypothetical protein